AVDHTLSVGRPIGSRFPRRLLSVNLASWRSRLGGHPPDPARAPHVPAIRDECQLAAVGTPRWREIVIPGAVVIARQAAVVILRDADRSANPSVVHRGDEDVPAAFVRR